MGGIRLSARRVFRVRQGGHAVKIKINTIQKECAYSHLRMVVIVPIRAEIICQKQRVINDNEETYVRSAL